MPVSARRSIFSGNRQSKMILPLKERKGSILSCGWRRSGRLRLPRSLLQQGAYTKAPGTAAGPTGTGKDTQESTGGQQLVLREGAREFLETQGVPFPPGASANFLPQSSRLIVRNTQDNLDLIDAIVEQLNLAIPKQVEIESKCVEISQNNLKELGFDWLLCPFQVCTRKVIVTGGTSGTGTPVNSADFPFLDSSGSPVGN